MATISLTIPDASLTRIIDGICAVYNYNQFIEGMQSPPTKAQFAKAQIIAFVKATVKNSEVAAANAATELTKTGEIDAIAIT